MYTKNFAKWLFNYLNNNSTEPEEVYRLLEQCNYCDTEASLDELEVICDYFEQFGEADTRVYVATASTIQKKGPEPDMKSVREAFDHEQEVKHEEYLKAEAEFREKTPPLATDYQVVGYVDWDELHNTVKEMLKDGWHLVGGISSAVRPDKGVVMWTQAMCRYDFMSIESYVLATKDH